MAPAKVEGVPRHPVHLGDAAQAVGVLDPVAVAVALGDGAGGAEELAHVVRDEDLAGMGPGGMDPGIEGRTGAPEGLQAEAGDLVRQVRQPDELLQGQVAQGGDELGAVDEGEPLFGLERHGCQPGPG